MVSISNDPSSPIGDRILEAAAYCVIAYGVERVTLAEIARRARVSRPTVYRRWPDIRSVLAALLTARIVGALDAVPTRGVGREAVVERIVAVADHLRDDEVVMSVLTQGSGVDDGLHRPNGWAPASRSSSTRWRPTSSSPRTKAACGPASRVSSRPCAC